MRRTIFFDPQKNSDWFKEFEMIIPKTEAETINIKNDAILNSLKEEDTKKRS